MMNKLLFIFVFSVVFLSCENVKSNDSVEIFGIEIIKKDSLSKKENGFEMYEMSEMAALMEQMYVDKQHFIKIHQAVMTDDADRDSFFDEQATQFIKAQELIYQDPKNAKTHFNNGIDACIQCHQVKCGGPIPKIKKLYIK